MNLNRGPFSYLALGAVPTNANVCNQYILTRLLLGNIKIINGNNVYRQQLDYSKLTPVLQPHTNGKAFVDFIKNEGISQSGKAFVNKTIGDNRPFF